MLDLDYTKSTALDLLRLEGAELDALYARADGVRRSCMGDDIFVRGIIEFSNVCANDCLYCGIRRSNKNVRRYTMPPEKILKTAHELAKSCQTTLVLQSGEISGISDKELGELLQQIKRETPLAITLSVGNRPREVYQYWRECGMDRYLLRFESSDAALFGKMHPDCTLAERIGCLRDLRAVGAQVGSGFLIGLPGETLETLADNILLCRELDLDMIGIGPFIPHPETPLAGELNAYHANPEMFFKAVAVLRIFNPDAHIPATTAFDAVFPGKGRNLMLQRGANVFMPNSTPGRYRKDYQLYPGKPCVDETAEECASCVTLRIKLLGRTVGEGPGHSIKHRES